jgi:hypothetical protein
MSFIVLDELALDAATLAALELLGIKGVDGATIAGDANGVPVRPIAGQAGVAGGSGAVSALTQRVVGANAQSVALLAAGARVAVGNGAGVAGLGAYRAVEAQLEVTAAATNAGDTLDAFLQTTIDGATWIDIAHFTQVLGNGGAKRFIAKVAADQAEAMFETGAALAAGAVRHLLGDQYRARWDIVDGGGGVQSFTFSVKANFLP